MRLNLENRLLFIREFFLCLNFYSPAYLGPHTSILLHSSQSCVVLYGNARRDIGHNGRADSLLHARRAVLLECEVYLQYSERLTIALNQHITQTTGGCYMSGSYLPTCRQQSGRQVPDYHWAIMPLQTVTNDIVDESNWIYYECMG
jgi:hypothetical protein